jgi:hypothetical protein
VEGEQQALTTTRRRSIDGWQSAPAYECRCRQALHWRRPTWRTWRHALRSSASFDLCLPARTIASVVAAPALTRTPPPRPAGQVPRGLGRSSRSRPDPPRSRGFITQITYIYYIYSSVTRHLLLCQTTLEWSSKSSLIVCHSSMCDHHLRRRKS